MKTRKRKTGFLAPLVVVTTLSFPPYLRKNNDQPMPGLTHTANREEVEEDKKRYLEKEIERFGMRYDEFVNFTHLQRTLPDKYNYWSISLRVKDFPKNKQEVFESSKDGIRSINIELSERGAEEILRKYNSN